jgi:phosphoribosylanthranilate isomerase
VLKICGIKDADTAIYAIEHGATAIGLVFAESPRKLDLSTAEQISTEVSKSAPEVLKVAVLRHRDLPMLPSILQNVRVDRIQVHGEGPMDEAIRGIPLIPAGSLQQVSARVHRTVLVDSPMGAGKGEPWDYKHARDMAVDREVILAGGLSANNVAEAIELARPHGVDVSSGVESRRGIKDRAMISCFLQAAKSALIGTTGK